MSRGVVRLISYKGINIYFIAIIICDVYLHSNTTHLPLTDCVTLISKHQINDCIHIVCCVFTPTLSVGNIFTNSVLLTYHKKTFQRIFFIIYQHCLSNLFVLMIKVVSIKIVS